MQLSIASFQSVSQWLLELESEQPLTFTHWELNQLQLINLLAYFVCVRELSRPIA